MTATQEIIAPIVHLNGTSKGALVDQRCDAYAAIGEAIQALKKAAPNGRDYYFEPGLMDKALVQHLRRLQVLTDLQDELEAEIGMIDR